MRSKKTFLWIISLVCLIAITGILYVYYLFNKTSHLPEYIPANASLVVYVNTQVLIKNSLSQGRDTSQWQSIKIALQKSPYLKGLKDPRDLGIDIFSGAAFVEVKSKYYLLLPINDAGKLQSYFDSHKTLFQKIDTAEFKSNASGNYLYHSNDHLVNIAFNKHVAVICQGSSNYGSGAFTQFLNMTPESSFKNSDNYRLANNDSAGIWFYADKKYVSATSDIKGVIQVKNGIRIVANDIKADKELTIKPEIIELPLNSIYTAKNGNMYYPIYRYMSQLGMLCRLGDQDDEFASLDFSRFNCLMTFGGPKTIQTESISYEYDDNFNKQTVKTLHTDTIESCALLIRGAYNKEFTNTSQADTTLIHQLDKSYKTYITMDESVLQYIAPLPIKFQLKAWHREQQTKNYYYFDLKIKSLPQWPF